MKQPSENSFNFNESHKSNAYVIRSELNIRKLLESLCTTDDIESILSIFSKIGIYLLSNPQNINMIIKFKPLYDKIRLILCQGQTTKIKMALNLISSLMFIGLDNKQSKNCVLRLYTQNMIRISGCLLSMAHLFSNCMMQHETWSALCQSLSETCNKCVPNQSYCSHLVPLCIKRCRRGSPEALLVLQSLLINHEKNVQIFYESDGMSIFSRENLLYTTYLQTLNTVIESTKPTQQDHIRKCKKLFKYLQRWIRTDENKSPVTQWAAIILYSRRKLLGIDADLSDEEFNDKSRYVPKRELAQDDTPDYKENPSSDTDSLLQNVMKEVYCWNTQNNINKERNFLNVYESKQNVNNNQFTNIFESIANNKNKLLISSRNDIYPREANFNYKYTSRRRDDSVLSFSFLRDQSNRNDDNKTKRGNNSYMFKNPTHRESNPNIQAPTIFDVGKDTFNRTTCTLPEHENIVEFQPAVASTPKTLKTFKTVQGSKEHMHNNKIVQATSSLEVNEDTFNRTTCTLREHKHIDEFKPAFVSTPKKLKRLKKVQTTNKYKNKNNNFVRYSAPKCDEKNRTMGAKFMDIINGSYSTVVQSISKLKNVFIPKSNVGENNTQNISKLVRRDSCSYSFSKYMRERDALANEAKSKVKEFSVNGSHFSNVNSSCLTCNDTMLLRHKLSNHPSLKETVKKLKMGINLYGCDFKKISRLLWAREPCMTPEVLYTLYRKLIAK